MSKALHCSQLSKSYQQGDIETKVLDNLDLTVDKGELLAIVGSSGCGKSTFLHLAGALDLPTSGEVFINDVNILELSDKQRAVFRNQHIGFIYQFHHLMMEFTALENVAMPLLIRGEKPKQAIAAATEVLTQVGLAHRGHHRPSELSGGERQRTAIARALVTKPSLILADEPTGNLDSSNSEQIYQLLNKLNDDGKTICLITHDENHAKTAKTRLYIQDGQLSTQGF